MHYAHHIHRLSGVNFIERYLWQVLYFIVLVSISSLAFALTPNNGPDTVCSAGAVQGTLSDASYNTIMSSYNSNTFQSVVSTPNNSIPLQVKMSMQELPTSTSNMTNSFTVNKQGSRTSFNINKTFDNIPDVATNITLSFRNSDTQQPLYLNNLALSAFDIDGATQNGANFDDYVKFTGITEDGSTINANIQSVSGSSVVTFDNGLRINNINNIGCEAKSLSSACQGSVVFNKPVKSVTLTYKNTERVSPLAKTNQQIDFLLDSYCYLPPSYAVTKDDGIDKVATGKTTNYTIKVINTGKATLTNIKLKDPAVTGLTKLSNISCDSSIPNNICRIAPTVSQLENTFGFNILSIPVGKNYSITVPTLVTADEGSTVTNTASIVASNLNLISTSDSNQVVSIFEGGGITQPATCPSGHKMYYLGENPPSYSPIQNQSLSWTSSSTNTNKFRFGNVTLKLAFSDTSNLDNGYPSYGSFANATRNAINMLHRSPYAPVNHRLSATINAPVSKFGFVAQDVDSSPNRYVESLSFDSSNNNANNGAFTFSDALNRALELFDNDKTISSKRWVNCNPDNDCDFNVDWGYQKANTPFVITHGNVFNTPDGSGQLMGYSDFYFCLAPPKLIIKKQLNGTRVNDTVNKRDQFEISVNDNASKLNSFTTSGTGTTLSDNLSNVIELSENQSYTISERALNGTALGDIINYSASYVCTNKATESTTVMPIDKMIYDDVSKTRSFNLSGVKYGDEISCIITNTPSIYTFSGTVFNDNGGLAGKTSEDNSGVFISELKYFNGIFDAGEIGISGTAYPDLKISLTDCSGSRLSNTSPQTISDSGEYKFSIPSSSLIGISEVCLIQNEPNMWLYAVDTSPNELKVTIEDERYNYSGRDFGEVVSDQAALVLKKYQYVHQCDAALEYTAPSINQTNISTPTTGFSINPINNIDPGKCIAYKVVASNHGHKKLTNIRITDVLQKNPLISKFHLPRPVAVSNLTTVPLIGLYKTSQTNSDVVSMGDNGVVITAPFDLPNRADTNALSQLILYFNTKYGTSADSQTK